MVKISWNDAGKPPVSYVISDEVQASLEKFRNFKASGRSGAGVPSLLEMLLAPTVELFVKPALEMFPPPHLADLKSKSDAARKAFLDAHAAAIAKQ